MTRKSQVKVCFTLLRGRISEWDSEWPVFFNCGPVSFNTVGGGIINESRRGKSPSDKRSTMENLMKKMDVPT